MRMIYYFIDGRVISFFFAGAIFMYASALLLIITASQ